MGMRKSHISKYVLAICTLMLISILSFSTYMTPVYAANTVLHDIQDAFTTVVDQVAPAVVSITSERKITAKPGNQPSDEDMFPGFPFPFPTPDQQSPQEAPESMGTGVIVQSNGYILTNDHVVRDADKVTVTLKNGKTYPGKVFRDPRGDLAVVKIDAKDLPVVKLGDSSKVKVGSWAIAIGSPFGYDQTVTVGIISGTSRQVGMSGEGVDRYYPNLIQTDASINPGNSGGPLVNIDGEVIGINTLIRSTIGGGNIGIGFAIPVNTAKFVMDQLITHGKVVRGFLGIQPDDLTPDQEELYGVSEGALVRSVEEGSPADKAGIQVEDIIVNINGTKITGQLDLREIIASTQPGKELPVTVIRNKQQKSLKVTLKEAPQVDAAEPSQEAIDNLGFKVSDITDAIAKKYEINPETKGVVVASVTPGSSASKAGLQPGLVIVKINNKPVTSMAEFNSVTKNYKSGDSIRLVIKTKDSTILVTFTLE